MLPLDGANIPWTCVCRFTSQISTHASRSWSTPDSVDSELLERQAVEHAEAVASLVASKSIQPNSLPAMTLAKVEATVRGAWSRDTSDDPDEWTESNAARGQCAATALVLYQLFGGLLLVSDVFRDGARVETHYWNRVASGIEIDLTREQFQRGETFGEPRVIDPATIRAPKPDSLRRAQLLSARVGAALGNQAMQVSLSRMWPDPV